MEQHYRRVISGQARGPLASIARIALRVVEPFYSSAMRVRNAAYDRGIFKSHRVDLPVISVGNITTGGTGKTPVVRWLVQALQQSGVRGAVLLRGYKARDGQSGDEDLLLKQQLGGSAVVLADPDRVRGARKLIGDNTQIDVIVLDDGFQHRRLQRDFDLVLIDATNPFGHDHVLPRGLLREPLGGLRRADGLLITRADQTNALNELSSRLQSLAPNIPIYRSRHAMRDLDSIRGKRIAAFCGIGNPEAFEHQLRGAGADLVAMRAFADHHEYSESDVREIERIARDARAESIITTEKDWVKLSRLAGIDQITPKIKPIGMQIEFLEDDGQRLLDQIIGKGQLRSKEPSAASVSPPPPPAPPAQS